MHNTLLQIDRGTPLDTGKVFEILRDKSLTKVGRQNKESLRRNELDLETVRFDKGQRTNGDTTPWVPLDAEVFLILWDEKSLIPESWKKDQGAKAQIPGETINIIIFGGTTVVDSSGQERHIYIHWDNDSNQWHVNTISLLAQMHNGGKSEYPCFAV